MAFKDWRDWKAWALIGITIAVPLGAWGSITVWGGPECVNDYDYWDGYEGGCLGGTIRYHGLGAFMFFAALAFILGGGWVTFYLFGVPTIPELIARSRWRRRQLFQWLERSRFRNQ